MTAPLLRLIKLKPSGDSPDGAPSSGTSGIRRIESYAAVGDLPQGPPDAELAVIDARADAAALRLLAEVRRRFPGLPVVMAIDSSGLGEDPASFGIADGLYLVATSIGEDALEERLGPVLAAIRSDRRASPPRFAMTHREVDQLQSICGPAPLHAASQMMGARPLREATPERFERLKADYRPLLDRTLELRIRGAEQSGEEQLRMLADRLGALNAGPRDVIDLHRLTIADVVTGQPPLKAEAFIDEGRLVLIQLMGYLASFYRSLTWGGRRAAAPRSQP